MRTGTTPRMKSAATQQQLGVATVVYFEVYTSTNYYLLLCIVLGSNPEYVSYQVLCVICFGWGDVSFVKKKEEGLVSGFVRSNFLVYQLSLRKGWI